ncbi:MAG: response regulator transcription factor, partial [Myxococcaceae bacterium]|nr:response regulator transcription factor [Myxococcaceae bacterium]
AALQRLTDRELETLAALGRGETNQQMAESMGVAVVTVKTHVSNVLAKLGLRDRTEAAVFAWRAGVVR